MSRVDDLFQKAGIDIPFERLNTTERERILTLLQASETDSLTIEKFQTHIYMLKMSVEQELTEIKDTPQNWVSLFSYFIPIYGMIKKWYEDQHTMALQGRLRNYILIYNIFANKKAARNQLESELQMLSNALKKERGGQGGEA